MANETQAQVVAAASAPWVTMTDAHGNVLAGIEGKRGVRARKLDGSYIGGDFIRMQPGAAFPLHTHDGEHIIYFIEGLGLVNIDGADVPVTAGDLINIPAQSPHNVSVPESFSEPLILVAVGHPHKHIAALDRMHVLAK